MGPVVAVLEEGLVDVLMERLEPETGSPMSTPIDLSDSVPIMASMTVPIVHLLPSCSSCSVFHFLTTEEEEEEDEKKETATEGTEKANRKDLRSWLFFLSVLCVLCG